MQNKQPKAEADVTNAKNRQHDQQKQNQQQQQQQQQHQQQVQQREHVQQQQQQQTNNQIERKLIVESNYNLNIKSNMNGLNKHKDNENKLCSRDNNSRKFAFLAQQTIPDYRPQPVC